MPAPSAASMGLPSWVDNPSQLKWDQSSVAMGTSPAKPGFDWLAAGAAAQDLFGGVSDLIRGIQGQPTRMAGSRLQEYLQNQKQESFINSLLGKLISPESAGGSASVGTSQLPPLSDYTQYLNF